MGPPETPSENKIKLTAAFLIRSRVPSFNALPDSLKNASRTRLCVTFSRVVDRRPQLPKHLRSRSPAAILGVKKGMLDGFLHSPIDESVEGYCIPLQGIADNGKRCLHKTPTSGSVLRWSGPVMIR